MDSQFFFIAFAVLALLFFCLLVYLYILKRKKETEILSLQISVTEQKSIETNLQKLLQEKNELLLEKENIISEKQKEIKELEKQFQTEREKHWLTKQAQIRLENDLNRNKNDKQS